VRRRVPRGRHAAAALPGVAARRLAAVLGAVPLVALLGATPAAAATYRVDTCGGGLRPGWQYLYAGAWSTVESNGCVGIGAGMSASIAGGALGVAGWEFTAPADTEIAGFSVTRSYTLAAARPFGASEYQLHTSGPGQDYRHVDSNFGEARYTPIAAESASGLSGQRTLDVWVHCGGGGDCSGPSSVGIYAARIDLRDDIAPVITGMSGSLLAAGAVNGTRSLSYGATDRGGGLLREQLVVDGQPWIDRAVDPARCTAGTFTALVPCPLSVSSTLALDTTRLAEGAHDVELAVWDATGVNGARQGPFPIVVDNVPAPSNTAAPRIVGSPVQGATLVADDGAWSGSGLTLTRRWQRYDEGEWADVEGATGSTYAAAAADAGHRLRLHVVAANAEGSAAATSAPTAPVAPLAVPAPTATATPAPTATATPAPTTPAPAATGPPAPSAPQPFAAPPGGAAARLTAAFRASGRTVATLRWGQTSAVAGRLLDAGGSPIAGAKIAVSSRASVVTAAPVPLRPLTTGADGSFAYPLHAGVSRRVTFTVQGATASVTARVIAHVTLHARRMPAAAAASYPSGVSAARAGTVVLSGRVRGAPSGVRKLVELQARVRGRWRTFATTRLARTGATFRYRTRTAARTFRAIVRAEPGWPFLTGVSVTTRG